MLKDRRRLGLILAIIILGAGGAYYYYGNGSQSQAQQSQETTIATAQVTRGDLTLVVRSVWQEGNQEETCDAP